MVGCMRVRTRSLPKKVAQKSQPAKMHLRLFLAGCGFELAAADLSLDNLT